MYYIISSIFKALKIISANKMNFKYVDLNGKQPLKLHIFVPLYNINFCNNLCFMPFIKVFMETSLYIFIFQQEHRYIFQLHIYCQRLMINFFLCNELFILLKQISSSKMLFNFKNYLIY